MLKIKPGYVVKLIDFAQHVELYDDHIVSGFTSSVDGVIGVVNQNEICFVLCEVFSPVYSSKYVKILTTNHVGWINVAWLQRIK